MRPRKTASPGRRPGHAGGGGSRRAVAVSIDAAAYPAIEAQVQGGSSVSAWLEDAAVTKLEQAERARRARRALEWMVDRAQSEHPEQWAEAVAAVRASDERRGYTTSAPAGPAKKNAA